MPAYLITFSSYGSHIPGQQGCIDRNHNVPGTREPQPRPHLRQHLETSLKQLPFEMDFEQRAGTLEAIREVCRYKNWRLFAAHVRTNHVHVVVEGEAPPELMMNVFKAYSSRALNRLSPQQKGKIRWTRHGSTRYLWSQAKLSAAVLYVLDKQGNPMNRYAEPPRP